MFAWVKKHQKLFSGLVFILFPAFGIYFYQAYPVYNTHIAHIKFEQCQSHSFAVKMAYTAYLFDEKKPPTSVNDLGLSP